MTVTTKIGEEEDEEGKVKKFHFSKQENVVLESENKFFFCEGKKVILSCLEKKLHSYSLEGQYPLERKNKR